MIPNCPILAHHKFALGEELQLGRDYRLVTFLRDIWFIAKFVIIDSFDNVKSALYFLSSPVMLPCLTVYTGGRPCRMRWLSKYWPRHSRDWAIA